MSRVKRIPLNRMGSHAALGIAEVWPYHGSTLHIYRLQPDQIYAQVDQSDALPGLLATDILRFIEQSARLDDTALIRAFRQWVHAQMR